MSRRMSMATMLQLAALSLFSLCSAYRPEPQSHQGKSIPTLGSMHLADGTATGPLLASEPRFASTLRNLASAFNQTSPEPLALPVSKRRVAWLATPDVAISLITVGVLLIFFECNLPGAVVPGAVGLLLLLSGVYGLSLLPLRPTALLVLFAAIGSLVLSVRAPLFGLPAVAGTGGLILSLWTLLPASAASAVHPAIAVSSGLLLGVTASLLGRVALRARRNKAVVASAFEAPIAEQRPLAEPSSRTRRPEASRVD